MPRCATIIAIAGGCAFATTLLPTGASGHALAMREASSESERGASPLARIAPVRVPLEVALRINGKFLGSISIAVDPKGNGEIDANRLVALITPVIDAKLLAMLNARIAGRVKVDFADLDIAGFTIRFDSLALEVIGTLAPDASVPSSLRLAQQQEVPIPSRFDQPTNFAAGVNIGASQRYVYGRGNGFEPVRVDLDGIANFGGFDGVTLTGGLSYDGERWQRREIRATHDLFDQAIRLTAGEFTPTSTSFQGSGHILGFGAERAYSTIRPFQNTRPIGRQQFTLERESTVEVLVNQIRVQTIRLAAGRYDIGDFPFAAGPNQVQLIVEDVGGRREIMSFDVFNNLSLLSPGITEFGSAIGIRDKGQLHYGFSPAVTGYVYHGISDTLTLGANGQATNRGMVLGSVAVVGTPIGFFQLETSVSKSFEAGQTGTGVAASLDYRGDFSIRSKNDLRIAASAVYRGASFSDAFAGKTLNLNALDAAVQVQWQAPYAISTGVGVSYSALRYGALDIYRYDLTLGRSFGRLSINMTGSRTVSRDDSRNDTRAAIGLSYRLGQYDNAFARYDSGTGRKEVEVSRSPEGRLGEISGNIRYTEDDNMNSVSGRLAYINNRFDLVVNHNRIERAGPDGKTSNASDWNASTFIGYTGGSFAIGRSVDEGFVIAPVHSTLRGSQASIVSGDRVVARSGLFGPALVPVGRAYGIGHYDILVDPLPLGYDLGTATINIFPGFGSGYHLMIGSDASLIAVGFLVSSNGPMSLVSGSIEPADAETPKGSKERGFFTNRAGRFVVDRLAPGRYRFILGGKSVAEFEVKKGSEGIVDVGRIQIAQ